MTDEWRGCPPDECHDAGAIGCYFGAAGGGDAGSGATCDSLRQAQDRDQPRHFTRRGDVVTETMDDMWLRATQARERASTRHPVHYGRDSGHCGRRACACTHDGPCDHGWLPWPDYVNPETGETYENASPCPNCRPDAAARLVGKMRRESHDA